MTKRRASDPQALPYFKVRIHLPGAVMHLASSTRPVVHQTPAGEVAWVEGDWISGTDEGDELGYIRWGEVIAVSWRPASDPSTWWRAEPIDPVPEAPQS